jgi:hypothetical protein
MVFYNFIIIVFKPFENPEYSIWHYKILYVLIQSVVLSFILYKVYGMGLLPLFPADWMALIDHKIPESKLFKI